MDTQEDEVSNAELVIFQILKFVETGQFEPFKRYLIGMNIHRLSLESQMKLVDLILEQIYRCGENNMVDLLFEAIDEINAEVTRIPTISIYLARSGLNESILFFIGSSTVVNTFETVFHGLNGLGDVPEVYEACINAEKVFGETPEIVLRRLEAYLLKDPMELNNHLYNFLMERMGSTKAPQARPIWIVDASGMKRLPTQSELIIPSFPNIEVPSPKEFTEESVKAINFVSGNRPLPPDITDLTDEMISAVYSMLSLENKIKRVNDYRKNYLGKEEIKFGDELEADNVLTLIFGPVNTNYDQVIKPIPGGNVCELYGGCRMLICTCSEANIHHDGDLDDYGDLGEPQIEWFKGKCTLCKKKIIYRHYALRKPLKNGGWVGCFCSFKCMNKTVKVNDLITPALIGLLYDNLMNLGIQDRRYSDKTQHINYI